MLSSVWYMGMRGHGHEAAHTCGVIYKPKTQRNEVERRHRHACNEGAMCYLEYGIWVCEGIIMRRYTHEV